jgi:hypothetical protein
MSRPIGPFQFHDRRSARRLCATLTLVLVLILTACGTESGDVPEDRQFANDPVEEQKVTATSEVIVNATPVVTEEVVSASPETLLRSRGTPNTLYTLTNDRLVALSIHDGEVSSTEIALPDGHRVIDFDGSPSGDRVAVVMSSEDASPSIAFLRASGEPIGETRALTAAEASATPVAAGEEAAWQVTWSPQGTGVVVASPTTLETIDVEGDPKQIPLAEFEGQLIGAAWSPQGSRIFLQFAMEDGSQHVYVRDLVADKTREVRVLGAAPGTGATDLQWLPDGSGLLYVQGPMMDGVVMRGQLYVYTLGQEVPRLISTSGQGGPSATMTDAVVSPDGRSVAYVISVLDGSEWVFHSMWVRALDGSLSYQVPVAPRGVVTNLAWFDRGIAWEQGPSPDVPGNILSMRQGEEPVVVFEAPSTDIAGTPGASPAVNPAGTPVPSPGATPVGTPGATPQ